MELKDKDIVIVGYARSAIGDFLGGLKDVSLVDLSTTVAKAAMERAGVKPEDVDELGMGCIYKHGNGGNPGRQVEIKCGIPAEAWAYYGGSAMRLRYESAGYRPAEPADGRL